MKGFWKNKAGRRSKGRDTEKETEKGFERRERKRERAEVLWGGEKKKLGLQKRGGFEGRKVKQRWKERKTERSEVWERKTVRRLSSRRKAKGGKQGIEEKIWATEELRRFKVSAGSFFIRLVLRVLKVISFCYPPSLTHSLSLQLESSATWCSCSCDLSLFFRFFHFHALIDTESGFMSWHLGCTLLWTLRLFG